MKQTVKKKQYKHLGIAIGVSLLVLLTSASALYFYTQYQSLKQDLKASEKTDAQDVIAKIGALMELPEGETPTVATVSDPEKLQDQPFFRMAKTGDKVLIYESSGKAILFRPDTNKIVDVALINMGNTNPTQTVSPTLTAQPPTFLLLNGTTKTGLTKTYEAKLKSAISDSVVVDTDIAAKRDYEKTVLIDIKGDKNEQSASIAKLLQISVSDLPPDEKATPSANFLIILGADQL